MRSIARSIGTVLAASLALTFFTMGANANDISGVKLGMSLAEAKSAFSRPPNMKIITTQTDRAESGFAGWRGGIVTSRMVNGPADEFIAFKGKAETIWYIQRNQRLDKADRYSRQALIEATRKKFGKESFTYGDLNATHIPIIMAWEYGQDGKQFFGSYTDGPCRNFDLSQIGISSGIGDRFLPEPMSIIIPTEVQRTCGRAYYIEALSSVDGIVEAVAARALDGAAILRAIDGKNARDEAENKQKTQQQLNKGVKPSF